MTSGTDGPTTTVFRAMLKDQHGSPLRGDGDCMLGARVFVDIRPDPSRHVHPGRGGMSVTPDDPSRLPPHFRPASLGGFGKLPVFRIEILHLGASLRYRPDPRKPQRHGFVEPAERIHLVDYQAALAATSPAWRQVP